MYGATAGPASAAGSDPAGRHARVFQVPCEAGEDEAGEDEADEDEADDGDGETDAEDNA